jgi:hypothetical protein
MTNTARFARLELASAQVNARQMVILAVMLAGVAWIVGSQEPIAFAATVPLLPIFFVTYPFLADERGRHDLLYATLPIRRRTVVWGRHLYFLVMELCTLVAAVALTGVVTLATGNSFDIGVVVLVALAAASVASLMLAVQLPVLFGLGFAKSRWLAMLPMVICLAPVVLGQLPGMGDRLSAQWPGVLTSEWTLAATGCLIAVLWASSALISVRLYARRQF